MTLCILGIIGTWGYLYFYDKQYDRSVEMLKKYNNVSNTKTFADMISKIYTIQGDYKNALLFADMEEDPGKKTYLKMLAYHRMGDIENFELMLGLLILNHPDMEVEIAEAYSIMNDIERSFEWLGRAYINKNLQLGYIKYNVFLENLHSERRWFTLLEKVGFSKSMLD